MGSFINSRWRFRDAALMGTGGPPSTSFLGKRDCPHAGEDVEKQSSKRSTEHPLSHYRILILRTGEGGDDDLTQAYNVLTR